MMNKITFTTKNPGVIHGNHFLKCFTSRYSITFGEDKGVISMFTGWIMLVILLECTLTLLLDWPSSSIIEISETFACNEVGYKTNNIKYEAFDIENQNKVN